VRVCEFMDPEHVRTFHFGDDRAQMDVDIDMAILVSTKSRNNTLFRQEQSADAAESQVQRVLKGSAQIL
jgi:hypothetical protein